MIEGIEHWAGLGTVTGALGFVMKWLHTRDARTDKMVGSLEQKITDLREKLPETYARRDDVKSMEERILDEVRATRDDVSALHRLITERLAR